MDTLKRYRFSPVLLLLGISLAGLAVEEPEYPHGDFEDDCSICHSDEGWSPAVIGDQFEHAELPGAHGRTACKACHPALEFNLADPACVSCHADIHRSEFGTDCSRCHTPRSFVDRSRMKRRHAGTRFPLQGAHRTLDCEQCHRPADGGSMQFVGTDTECRDCHLDRYLSTNEPDHQELGFPQDCVQCHSPTRWDRVRGGFNHDAAFFPIFSGTHRNRWNSCSDCHVGGSFDNFSCLQCHPHDNEQDGTDDHEGISGFMYDSNACYACHPRGTE